MPSIPIVEHRQLKSCLSDLVYGDPKGTYIAAIILAIALTMVTAMSVMLSLIASRQKKKLKELQFVRQKASKYQAIVHTAQAQALASQLKVENYEKENLRLSTAVEQWRRSYVELANNHHNSTRPSQYPSSPLRHVESVSPVSSTATSEYEGFSESAPPSDGYCGSDDQSFTARTERMMAEIRAEQDASNRVADKPPQIPASSLSF